MSASISGAISLFFTVKSVGFSEFSIQLWVTGSWIYALAIAFPMAYFLPKFMNKFLSKLLVD